MPRVVWATCFLATIAIIAFGMGFVLGRENEVPGTTEFWRLAAQPVATIITASLALVAAGFAYMNGHYTRMQDKDHHWIDRSWSRFEWLVEKASEKDQRNQIPIEMTVSTLSRLSEDTKHLADPVLRQALAEFGKYVADLYVEALPDVSLKE